MELQPRGQLGTLQTQPTGDSCGSVHAPSRPPEGTLPWPSSIAPSFAAHKCDMSGKGTATSRTTQGTKAESGSLLETQHRGSKRLQCDLHVAVNQVVSAGAGCDTATPPVSRQRPVESQAANMTHVHGPSASMVHVILVHIFSPTLQSHSVQTRSLDYMLLPVCTAPWQMRKEMGHFGGGHVLVARKAHEGQEGPP